MQILTRTASIPLVFLVLIGIPVSTFAQSSAQAVESLSENDAVRLALENNLGIQIARITPQIEDLSVAEARTGWTPSFTTQFDNGSTDTPNNSFLSGAMGNKTSDSRTTSTIGVQQLLPWGGNYTIGWDGTRSKTTNVFSNFSPQLRSSLSLSYTQPLLRNFSIDGVRQQLELSERNRDISEIELQRTLAETLRAVRNSYWELVFARASLEVQRQSLQLALESLRNTRARVEIGTMAPIDIVEAEAEVATREEAVIVAEASIETAEDTLRTMVYNPAAPDFWTLDIETQAVPLFTPKPVDVDAAVVRAIQNRTDLRRSRTALDATDVNIRYLSNQTLPDISASLNYGLTGLGGTQFIRGDGFPGPIIGEKARGFGPVLGDIFYNTYPAWTLSLNFSYPLGTSQQEAGLAKAKLQYKQAETEIRNNELRVVTEVRSVGRQVRTNQRRVETTNSARQLAERRLEAEEQKFAAGTSTSFLVFQAQRDLALAQNNELRAILDYNRSVVDFETVPEAPLTGN
jgi:outer membrane protein TolC